MSKQVLISRELFMQLCCYHLANNSSYSDSIQHALNDKMNALINAELYSKYKAGATHEEREQARQAYLNKRDIPQEFRW